MDGSGQLVVGISCAEQSAFASDHANRMVLYNNTVLTGYVYPTNKK